MIIGCGYRGRRLEIRLIGGGHRVFGLTRSPQHADEIASLGLVPVRGDLSHRGIDYFSAIADAMDISRKAASDAPTGS